MLNDDRSINTVDEMLGIIPGQTRSYVASATGSIAMGGTPLNPYHLPIHTANCITGKTAGDYSVAAQKIIEANTGTNLVATTGSRSFTVSTGTPPAGAAVYDTTTSPYTYVGTVLSGTTFVNYSAAGTINAATYGWIPVALKDTVAYTYNVTLPTDSMPVNNVSYTIQAGDDFEQEVMKYAKCTGFSAQGGAGGTIDMQSSYMGQAVQLGYVGDGLITTSTSSPTVNGTGTAFINTTTSSDIGRKLYTLDNQLIGTIKTVISATQVELEANATVALTNSQYRLGGFSSNVGIPSIGDDLIFARTRLFIDDVQAWPVSRPTPVIYQFLAFSMQLQCTWATKFTGEGYQGIDPTWAFALFTNYQVGGDFTIEHDTIASGKKSSSSVESLKYAWRNRVPKIIQVDCPSSTSVNWHTVTTAPTVQTLAYSLPALEAGTISIAATDLLTVTGVNTTFTPYAGKKLCVFVNGSYYYVGNIASVGGTGTLTLSENLYGVIPAGSSFTIDGTKITAGGGTPFTGNAGKDVFKNATTWIGRIANVESGTVAHTYVSSAIGAFTAVDVPTFIMESCTQPYFPVVGQGPLKTYTGVSFRVPVLIMSVSGINDNDGNDIVTVSWQQRYDPTVGNYGGDIRIVNQAPSLSVAN